MSDPKNSLHEKDSKKILPPRAAGEYLGISPLTLANWRVLGKGPRFIRLSSRKIAYRLYDLEAWLTERVFSSTTEADQAGCQMIATKKDEWRMR